ncbi:ATP-binding cassette domain-containing protein [Actinomadura luteofluorescens]|uniref:ATP-binding cassette domain-containing protein n=1 Tax=Actinomadura luteofluorescens TaxID=46163 RepID=UPI00363CC7D8
MSAPVLELTGIAKSFGAVPALVSVDLVVEPGTIVGLLGQNGSGKSTLVKILTGIHRVDAGEIRFHGSVLESPVRHASRRGIVVIHQDLGLHPRLSVLDNVGVGDGYATGKLLPRSRRGELGTFRRLGERLGIDLDPWRLVGELSPAERVFVAVIRALRELEHGGGDGLAAHPLRRADGAAARGRERPSDRDDAPARGGRGASCSSPTGSRS